MRDPRTAANTRRRIIPAWDRKVETATGAAEVMPTGGCDGGKGSQSALAIVSEPATISPNRIIVIRF